MLLAFDRTTPVIGTRKRAARTRPKSLRAQNLGSYFTLQAYDTIPHYRCQSIHQEARLTSRQGSGAAYWNRKVGCKIAKGVSFVGGGQVGVGGGAWHCS